MARFMFAHLIARRREPSGPRNRAGQRPSAEPVQLRRSQCWSKGGIGRLGVWAPPGSGTLAAAAESWLNGTMTAAQLHALNQAIISCERCPRLIAHCQRVAREKRRAYREYDYWGRPLPGMGDPEARVLMVGLAPAAHGANRTGRMFTGDGSADFLIPALFRSGFANQPTSIHRDDGLMLRDMYLAAAAHCAPPDNKPTLAELVNCRPFLVQHLALLPNVRVLLALGRIGFDAVLAALTERGLPVPRPRPVFGHAAEYAIGPYLLVASYHPSRQNTQTGRLTPDMFHAVFARVRRVVDAL
jgi:uracil-DNA glycosylase